MKILVAKNEDYCGKHSLDNEGVQAQLVILDYCPECNPTNSDFMGIEDGEVLGEAVVMDRPDFNRRTYELTIRAGLEKKFPPENDEDCAMLDQTSRAIAEELLHISEAYEPGSVVIRAFGEYDIYYQRKAS